jgi:hypothetical protein
VIGSAERRGLPRGAADVILGKTAVQAIIGRFASIRLPSRNRRGFIPLGQEISGQAGARSHQTPSEKIYRLAGIAHLTANALILLDEGWDLSSTPADCLLPRG